MTPEDLRRRWVEALRSGDYVQGRGDLKSGYLAEPLPAFRYCCLGVLLDVVDPKAWSPGVKLSFAKTVSVWGEALAEFSLPDAVLPLVGITRPQEATLISMNDLGISFEVIAEKIEEFP